MVLVVLLACAAVLGAQWLFIPWAFYLGGRFHPLPMWQAAARVHARSGDYVLYVMLSPTRGGRGTLSPSLTGSGFLCTSRGERYPLHLFASLLNRASPNANGAEVRIDAYRRPWWFGLSGAWDRRPRLVLHGRWQTPDLVMSDGGTLSSAFLPDGRLYDGPERNQPRPGEPVQIVLRELPLTMLFPSCENLK